MNNKVFGYIRVSSKEQNIERQLNDLLKNNINERDIYIDKQSGKNFDRCNYNIMKSNFRKNDLLIIKSIDRLGRNYEMILNEWQELTKEYKIDIKVLDMPLLDTTKDKDLLGTFISDLILQILSYVAHQERTFINARQKDGIKNAKEKGVKFGRPKIIKPNNFEEIITKWKNKEIKSNEAMKLLNLKPNTFYNFVKNSN